MNNAKQQEETLFDLARNLTDPVERKAFLDAACANNAELRRRLENLLSAAEGAEKFFEESGAALSAPGGPAEPATGESEKGGTVRVILPPEEQAKVETITNDRAMSTLTKDQIQKLSAEQQADMAVLELERARVRQRLLEQARSCRGQTIVAVLSTAFVMIPLGLLGSFRSSFIGSLLLVISIGAVFVGTCIQINLINRRIDALIKLLEHDLRDPIESAKS